MYKSTKPKKEKKKDLKFALKAKFFVKNLIIELIFSHAQNDWEV